MKKTAFGMLVVLALTLGLASRGESATVSTTGCVSRFRYNIGTNGTVAPMVHVGQKVFWFQPNGIKLGAPFMLNLDQLAKWAPILAQFRDAAARNVKTRVYYDSSSKWVKRFELYRTRC